MQRTSQFKLRISPANEYCRLYWGRGQEVCDIDTRHLRVGDLGEVEGSAIKSTSIALKIQSLTCLQKLKKLRKIFLLDQYNLSTLVWWYYQKLLLVSTTPGFLCMSNSRQNLLTQCLVVECWCMHRKSRDSDMAPAWERSCAGFTSVGLPIEK